MAVFKKRGPRTAIWSFDHHLPYHDKKALKLMMKVAVDLNRREGLDEFGLGGDVSDCYVIGNYARDPALPRMLKVEIAEVGNFLDDIDRLFPKSQKVYIEGNHENRFTRFIRDRAPELYGLIDYETLFNLKNRKRWKWVPYGPYQKYNVLGSKLIARHEPMSAGEHVAANTVKRAGTSVMFGHVHKIQEFQVVTLDGSNLRGISSGWLGNKDHPAFNYVKNHHQWAQGFNVVRVLPNGRWFNQVVHIIDYKCCVDGKIYSI